MEICIVNPFFYPYEGGIERRIRAIGKRLSRNNEISLITSRLPGTEPSEVIDGIKIFRLPSKYLKVYNPPIVFSQGIKQKIKELEPDVLNFHYRWSPEYTLSLSSFLEKIPIVFTWHNSFGEGEGWQKPISYLNDVLFGKLLAKKCNRIICVSKYLKKELVNRNFDEEKIRVIYNGINPKKPSSQEKDFILFVGRLVKTKGLDILAIAMKDVDYRLKVCGRGPDSDRLERIENIDLLGYVSEKEKIDLLKKCKFLVLPSKKEGFGIVLLEAMSFGKPVIATKTGGIPEVVGSSGILVPPNDAQELKTSINKLLSDDQLRQKLGKEAYGRVNSFSWDKIARQTEQVYRDLLN